ncbi:MAG: hypothetical protein JST68_13990 [Bacteroidetes bacterium]|nr:hypothetical protein [Bacteroidota bacterium]
MKPRINPIEYLYFNIYSYFYRIAQYRESVNHRMQAMYLFSLGLGGWLLFLESTYLHFVRHTRFASKMQSTVFAGAIYMLTAGFFHYIFIVKDRDQKIVGKYEQLLEQHPKRGLHLFLSICVLVLPYLLLAAFAVIFKRHS